MSMMEDIQKLNQLLNNWVNGMDTNVNASLQPTHEVDQKLAEVLWGLQIANARQQILSCSLQN